MQKILVIFGTRPEAIKMAPVVAALREAEGVTVRVCVTAQHRQMLDQVLQLFQITPEYDLDLMRPGQGLADITSGVLHGVTRVLMDWKPDWIVVHGDTTTSMAAGLAGFYQRIKVAHVEAGLRSFRMDAPWPEELNRRITGLLADMHFAPTQAAARNLERENVPQDRIQVTGNTVIDALFETVRRVESSPDLMSRFEKEFSFLDPAKRLILVTAHRRESFGEGFERICLALNRLSEMPNVELVYPLHMNPAVREPMQRNLGKNPKIHLIEPLEYMPFVYLMKRAYLILTDSGGMQEEAPALGKPVLVLRDTTERPEAMEAGKAILVGTDERRIVREVERLLKSSEDYEQMAKRHNPFGDGDAALRIGKFFSKYGSR